jgi:hypothetical protein
VSDIEIPGGAGAEPVQLGQKQKTTVLKPIGAQVLRLQTGETVIELEISPFEAVSLMMPEEGRQALVRALTGGIELAGPRALPPVV